MIGREGIVALEQALKPTLENFSILKQNRDRFELIDKYVAKESATHAELVQGQAANRNGDKRKTADFEAPLCHIYGESALAFYASIFLSGYPTFGVVASKKNEQAATAMMALLGRDGIRFNWTKELLMALRDGIRYNFMGVEVIWADKRAISVSNSTTTGSDKTGTHKAIVYSGNSIRRMDPYNTFWDSSVPLSKVHEEGAYVGYFERKNYIQLKQFIHGMNDAYLIRMNVNNIFKSGEPGGSYHRPQIRKDPVRSSADNWDSFFGFYSSNKGGSGKYEVVTAYMRIIPREYRITVPASGEVQVFKFIWVNGFLLYAEPIIAGHEYLPIVLSPVLEDGLELETKSFTEYIMDHQDLASSLVNASMSSMRRAVTDRGLYNPNRIKASDINSPVPNAKIPVRFTSYDQNFENAYKEIPYHDTVSGLIQQNLSMLFGLTDQATGINRAQQGAFQKGNKTLYEYDDVMKNAQGRLMLGALGLESSFFVPVKQILKVNYLQFAISETVFDLPSKTTVEIDPTVLREAEVDFKMSDGLMPSGKLANVELTNTALGLLGQFPDIDGEFKLGELVISVLKQSGMTNLEDYRRTQDEKKQYQAEQAQRLALMTAAKNGAPQQ